MDSIDAIEAAIQQDVGRNIAPMFAAARGGLRGAVAALANACGPIGVITGFFVPAGRPPAAETDGPVGAALLARGFHSVGLSSRVCTDGPCASACRVALAAAGVPGVPVDVGPVADVIALWRGQNIRHVIAIERCGRTADGTPRNMRGQDISNATTLLDDVFLAGPWDTIAIGDGGNEIGMGNLPREVIAAHVVHGADIACVTPATHLILAGVSHWGAYALLGGLAVVRPDWREALLACLDPALDQAILETTVRDGPAVDGVTCMQTATIDTFEIGAHHRVLAVIANAARGSV